MKKFLWLVLILILACVVLLPSCDEGSPAQTTASTTDSTTDSTTSGDLNNGEEPQNASHVHLLGEWIIDSEATCTEDGSRHQVCSVCNATVNTETIKSQGHTDGEWISDLEAGCTNEGLRHKACTVCGVKTKEESIPITHNYVNNVCGCGSIRPSEGLEYTAIGEFYAVSGIGTCTDENLIIPDTYNGKPVTEISSQAFSNLAIKKVTVPKSVSKIGDQAFTYCYQLANVVFEENGNLTTIGQNVFSGTAIVSITLPEGLKRIEAGAFNGCHNLEEISLPSTLRSIGKNAFRYSTKLNKVFIKDIAKWCGVTFEGGKYANPLYMAGNLYSSDGTLVTDLKIPEGVTAISSFAFYGVKSVNSISFPTTLRNIYSNAFYECSVSNIYIDDLASWCKVSAADKIGYSNKKLYLNKSEITSLTIPGQVTSVGKFTFAGFSSIASVTMSNSVTSIGEGAFSDCQNLENFTFSNELTAISKGLFKGCTKLRTVDIPNKVTLIDASAFACCTSLSEIVIPALVTRVGESAFNGCTSLAEVFVSASVKHIGKNAFDGCTGLVQVDFECKEGWTCNQSTIYKYMLEGSQTVNTLKNHQYAAWERN